MTRKEWLTLAMQKIMKKVLVDANGCWLFMGSRNEKGYGLMYFPVIDGFGRKTKGVHRISAELHLWAFAGSKSAWGRSE